MLFISTVYSQMEERRSSEYHPTCIVPLFASVSTVLCLSINNNLWMVSAGMACKHPHSFDFEEIVS